MGTDEIYVRDKFSAFKTDEEGYNRIVKHYGRTKKISKFQYCCIIAARRVVQWLLLTIWLLLFIFHRLYEIFTEWYEDFVRN